MNKNKTIHSYFFLDASCPEVTFGLASSGGQHCRSFRWATARDLSARLIAFHEEMLAAIGLSCAELGFLVVGTGPGSLTGLRVAIAFLRTTAWLHKLPLLGVDRFAWGAACLASQGIAPPYRLVVPAFLDKAFVVEVPAATAPDATAPDATVPDATVPGSLPPPRLLALTDIPRQPDTFAINLDNARFTSLELRHEPLHRLILQRAGQLSHECGGGTFDVARLQAIKPLYVVPSQAELRFSGAIC